jgi:hypothetical protein
MRGFAVRAAGLFAGILFMFGAAALGAEETIPLWGIVPKEDANLPAGGKIVALEGVTGDVQHRFVVEGLKITQPVIVMLTATNEGDDLQLQIAKYGFDHPERTGSTKDERSQIFRFRTEGDLKIAVSAAKAGMPYQLLVWTGDPIQPLLDPVLVPPAEYTPVAAVAKTSTTASAGIVANTPPPAAVASSSFGSPVLWVIAGLLFAIVALLAIVVLRRRPA